MVPLFKPGKEDTQATSYREINLTNNLCKTLQRTINLRKKFHLESEKLFPLQQVGLRLCYSTKDHTTYLSQEIEDAFQDKRSVLVAWTDLKKAFEKVWKEGLLQKR